MIDPFLLQHLNEMDDFWQRKITKDVYSSSYNAYGHPVHFQGNAADLLESAELSAARYSWADLISDAGINIAIIEQPQLPDITVPDNFPTHLHYQAINDSVLIWGLPWVVAHADLKTRSAVAIVSPALVHAPVYLSRYVMDTLTLNMLIHTGVGQLHASCILRDGRAVLLNAPHNTGKSTTAFRLVRYGYQLVSDGMTYMREKNQKLCLMGYPVGEIKLRRDVLDEISDIRDFGKPQLVREATKMVIKLSHALPESVIKSGIYPDEINFCLLERGSGKETEAYPISVDVALEGLWYDAAHYDDLDILSKNLHVIRTMLKQAKCYKLIIGSNIDGIVRVVNAL